MSISDIAFVRMDITSSYGFERWSGRDVELVLFRRVIVKFGLSFLRGVA